MKESSTFTQDIIYNYRDVGEVMVAKEGSDLPLQTNPELSENTEEELNDSDSCEEAAKEQCDEKNPTCKMNHQQNLKKVLILTCTRLLLASL